MIKARRTHRPEGGRSPGRTRYTWMDNIKMEDLCSKNTNFVLSCSIGDIFKYVEPIIHRNKQTVDSDNNAHDDGTRYDETS
jgi:hypothetical protein